MYEYCDSNHYLVNQATKDFSHSTVILEYNVFIGAEKKLWTRKWKWTKKMIIMCTIYVFIVKDVVENHNSLKYNILIYELKVDVRFEILQG